MVRVRGCRCVCLCGKDGLVSPTELMSGLSKTISHGMGPWRESQDKGEGSAAGNYACSRNQAKSDRPGFNLESTTYDAGAKSQTISVEEQAWF